MMPSRKLGIVILGNRGNQYPNEPGRRIPVELAAAFERFGDIIAQPILGGLHHQYSRI